MRTERRQLRERREGKLRKALGVPLGGETAEQLDRIGERDRARAERGLVAIVDVGGGITHEHLNDLTALDMRLRTEAEGVTAKWLRERVERYKKGASAPPVPAHLARLNFSESSRETVRKGGLRRWLGNLPSMRRTYQTDLSDAEWQYIEPYLPTSTAPGRPRVHTLREITDAIFYIVRSGCAWRLLPHDFPPWKTVHHYFRRWRIDGTWERMHSALRKRVRVRLQRNPQPSAAIVDSQSIKTTGVGGKQRGYDGAKKVKGRKRHLLVDTQGLVIEARVHSAEVQDREGIKLLLDVAARERLPERLSHVWLDAGYTGQDKGAGWVERMLGWSAEIVRHPPKPAPEEVMRAWVRELDKEGIPIDVDKLMAGQGPRPFLPKRWIVERTFSWLSQNRRLSKDYERLPETGEAFIYVAMSRLMARRLALS